MRKIGKISACLLSVLLLLTVVSCGKKPESAGSGELSVWSTYSSLKVMRDIHTYPNLGKKIDVEMAKGETEGAQLFITPEYDVKSFDFKTSNLVSGENVFKKENVAVYIQKYLNVIKKTNNQTNMKYPVGYTPDFCLPIEKAVEYGENTVGAGHNQGITVEFKTTSETPAGVYTGSFELIVDGASHNIPVRLEVWDIDISVPNGKTCVYADGASWLCGDFDNTSEMYKTYYEISMNDYKYMLQYLPGYKNPVKNAESADYYYDNPNFTTYTIPLTAYVSEKVPRSIYKGELFEYIMQLALKCKPNRILFDKAFMQPPHLDEIREVNFPSVKVVHDDIYDVEEKVIIALEESGYFDEFDSAYKTALCDAIRKVPIILNVDAEQINYLGDSVNSYCSVLYKYDSATYRKQVTDVENAHKDRGGTQWFYTCMLPIYPYPSLHIDDGMLGARIMRWMQKGYDIDGFLHWSFFYFHDFSNVEHMPCNPYEKAERWRNSIGDGFMVYPGKKYGVNGYLPSVRLFAFRDGQEDYDLLCALEKVMREKESFFGLPENTVSSNSITQELHKALYGGAIYVDDDANFFNVRRQLVNMILSERSDETKLLTDSNVTYENATTDIYVANGYDVSVNGENLQGTAAGGGFKYTYSQTLDENAVINLVISKDGEAAVEKQIFIASKTQSLRFDDESAPISVSKKSEVTYADGKAAVTLCSSGDDVVETLTFEPKATFTSEKLGVALNEIDVLTFELKNTTDRAITLRLRFNSGAYSYTVGNYELAVGGVATIELPELYALEKNFSLMPQSNFEIVTDNLLSDGETLAPDVSFEISKFYYSVKRT